MKRKSKVYLKLFLSYLGILIIPILVAGGIYGRVWQIMRAQTSRINENLLNMVQQEIDNEIKNIQKIESRLALDNGIQNLSKEREFQPENQQSLYHLYNELRIIRVAEALFNHVFVYFPKTEKISSSLGNMDISLYYELYYKNETTDFESFKEYLALRHYNDVLPITGSDGKNLLLFTMSSLNTNVGEAATIGIAVDAEQFRQKLLFGKWDEKMYIRITDSQNSTICMDAKSDTLPKQMTKDSYIVTSVNSNATDWRYEAIVPKALIDREAYEIQIWSAIGLFICIISGFGIASWLARKNYNPLKLLTENFANQASLKGNDKIERQVDEYQWLNQQMNHFFKEHIDTQRLLKNSRKTLKTYYLSQMLMEHCEKSPQEQTGILLHSKTYAVVLLKPEGKGMPAVEQPDEGEQALRKFIIANVLSEICQNYFEVEMTEMGQQEAAIIGMNEPSQENMELLQECVENLQQITEESFDFSCTALLGTACSGIGGIHESYMQAQAMEEYINLLDTPILRYDKVQDLRFIYEYPEELEQKIIHAMKIGDEKTAGQCMMEVFDRNLSGQVKANTYRCLIFDMIGTLLKGANTGGYHHADREIELLEQLSVKTPVEEARDSFLKCLALICSQIRQIRMQASSDHIFSQKVEMYVKENFTDPDLNISIASQHFRMTPSYLSSLYKKQTGKSLLEFINNVRIDFAERLLKEGCSVADAAEQSGFRDSASFIRAFKKKKGITPGQLKKEF